MKFTELLETVGDAPLFESALLLAGDVDPDDVRRQLSRWTSAGKLIQLRRGLYTLAAPYQKNPPHPFLVANYLTSPSYVSLQTALAHDALIPEYTAVITSVTTGRPERVETPLGHYEFRHVQTSRFYGFRLRDVALDQQAFVADPEKALLDLVYLHPGGEALSHLRGLRLQNLDQLSVDRLQQLVQRADSLKLERAVANITSLIKTEAEIGYETLS